MIKIDDKMNIVYDGKGATTLGELLAELGKQLNPDGIGGSNEAGAREAWIDLGIHADELLRYCPGSCHHDLSVTKSQRPN